ncbi:hypothetical protein ACELLULO517_19320 [Acidisoma cellulosilytica]|uniref:Uncharacterized protein n=1 Tax=Acidisoma cellulosilyticum TaxID=2802395 RepID=A0A964E5G7_9PROT|nr:hypothetical protein [Acidisoma cellulosilyticum]MCB8882407.1 hypothetical protein [Acidisoma cellulosilyticum]
MRIPLAVAALCLLGVETLPAMAGETSAGATLLSCAVLAGQTALPTDLCRHLETAFLGATDRIDFSGLLASNPAMPLLERRPAAATSPMAPGTALKTSAGWQAHLDRGVASYRQIFNGQGLAYALPAAPSVLWPGGNPFLPNRTE